MLETLVDAKYSTGQILETTLDTNYSPGQILETTLDALLLHCRDAENYLER